MTPAFARPSDVVTGRSIRCRRCARARRLLRSAGRSCRSRSSRRARSRGSVSSRSWTIRSRSSSDLPNSLDSRVATRSRITSFGALRRTTASNASIEPTLRVAYTPARRTALPSECPSRSSAIRSSRQSGSGPDASIQSAVRPCSTTRCPRRSKLDEHRRLPGPRTSRSRGQPTNQRPAAPFGSRRNTPR